MTKKDLESYIHISKYVDELECKKKRLEKTILSLENRLAEIENGEIVVDTVSGGNGGIQHFRIEGVPSSEYTQKKSKLLIKKSEYNRIVPILEEQMVDMSMKLVEIETFISSVDDVLVKRIINLRFIERMSWDQIASKIGGGNSEDSLRMILNRYLK